MLGPLSAIAGPRQPSTKGGLLVTADRLADNGEIDANAVHDEMERARLTFRRLLEDASPAALSRPSNGTRWTNRQLLFHMLLGYLIVRALLRLVRIFGRAPDAVSAAYARLLNMGTKPFDVVNYVGSYCGGRVLSRSRMIRMFDGVIAVLHRRLSSETADDLACGMHYPRRWDPFFKDVMTLADVYHFPTQHFDFHQRQLSLDNKGPD